MKKYKIILSFIHLFTFIEYGSTLQGAHSLLRTWTDNFITAWEVKKLDGPSELWDSRRKLLVGLEYQRKLPGRGDI